MATTSEPAAGGRFDRLLFMRRLTLSQRKKVWAYALIALPMAYFLFVNFAAMLDSFIYSFQNYLTLSTDRPWVGLANYQSVLADPIFGKALQNTLTFALVRVPIMTVLSLGIALMLHSIRRFKAFFRIIYFMPFVTSGVAIAWVFTFMYLPNFGLFTALFDALHVPRVNFLGDPKTALLSIIAVTIWASLGYYVLIFLAGLEDIPGEFYEAARVDGASAIQSFRKITLPLLNRTIVLVVILCMISSLQNFTYVRLMSKDHFGGPLNSTVTMSLLIYKQAFFSLQMGKASAIAVIFFMIILVLTVIQRRLITREYDYT
ncbi:MAG: sugar ABC transporter permease [Anaerolineae bacterium]|nr:sugar ABC transporter permease [Anaerolineae bacterium]